MLCTEELEGKEVVPGWALPLEELFNRVSSGFLHQHSATRAMCAFEMAAKGSIKNLYRFFKTDVEKHFPQQSGGLICPLCLQTFFNPSLLSKAHLWPEALGGRIYTLACRQCNSYIGTKIEKHEVERVKYMNQEKLPFKETTEGVEGSISGSFFVKEIEGRPTLIMEISNKHSNPSTLAESKRLFTTKEILHKKVTLSYKGKFNRRNATLTYLRGERIFI